MEEDSITIMVVRQSGKIRTVKIAPRKLYVFFSGLSGLVLAFFVLLYGYIEAYQRNSGLSTTVRSIIEAQEITSTHNPVALMPTDTLREETRIPSEETDGKIPGDSTARPLPPEMNSQVQNAIAIGISIDEFRTVMIRDPQGLKFSFRLSNVPQEGTLSGFLAVIGSSDRAPGGSFGAYPETAVESSGELSDYRRGDWFSIRRFKYVQGVLPLSDKVQGYSRLVIYVYSEDGKLLLRKTMDVTPEA